MLIRNKVAIWVVGAGIAAGSAYAMGTSDTVVTRVVRDVLPRFFHGPTTFRGASFSFLHGIEVYGLCVLDPEAPFAPPVIEAERAHLDYVLDVTGYGPRVTGIEIEKPRLFVAQAPDGSFPIVTRVFTTPTGPAAPQPRIKMTGADVTFPNAKMLSGTALALHDISITVTPATPRSVDFGGAEVELSATSDLVGALTLRATVDPDQSGASVVLDLPAVHVEPTLASRFAGDLARRVAETQPTGELAAHVETHLAKDKAFAADVRLEVRDLSLRVTLPEPDASHPRPQPIAVSKLRGKLHFAGERLDLDDVAFQALGGAFTAQGVVEGVTSSAPRLDMKASIAHLSVTEESRNFLSQKLRRVPDAFDLRGLVDATATVRGEASSPEVAVDATVSHGHVRYVGYPQEDEGGRRRGFSYSADDATGTVSFAKDAIHVDATGRHGPARLKVTGQVLLPPGERSTPDLEIVANDVPLDDSVRDAFGDPRRAERSFVRWHPSGTARQVNVHVWRDPKVDADHDAIDITLDFDGHADFVPHLVPVPLRNVKGRIEVLEPIVDGRRDDLVKLTDVTAQGDGFDARVSGEVWGADETERQNVRVHVDVADAAGGIRKAIELSPRIPDGARKATRELDPAGSLAVDAAIVGGPGSSAGGTTVDFALHGVAVRGWGDVPLAARNVTGKVHLEGDTLKFEDIAGNVALVGVAPAFRAYGRLLDISGNVEPDVHVEAPEVPLSEPALRQPLGSLAAKASEFWNRLAPRGSARADLVLDLRPSTHATPFEMTLTHIRGALLPLGLELDNEDGTFHYRTSRDAVSRVEIRGLKSAIGAASVEFQDVTYVEGGVLDVHASVRGLHFPEDLEGPLSHDAVAAMREAAPGRTLHVPNLHVVYRPSPETVEVTGDLSIRPRTRRDLPDPGYAPDGTLEAASLVFEFPPAFPPDAPVQFHGEGRAKDFSLNAGLFVDRLNGPVVISGPIGKRPLLTIATDDASLRVEGYPLEHVAATVEVLPHSAHVGTGDFPFRAKFMGGDLWGYVVSATQVGSFHGELHLKGADLERFLRMHSDPQKDVATGKVDADVWFDNPTGAKADLRNGRHADNTIRDNAIKVHDGELAPIPVLHLLLSVPPFGLLPEPMFSDARMDFDLDGERLDITKLEITGPGVTVGDGSGTIGFDGRLDVTVHPQVDPLRLPLIQPIVRLLQKPFPITRHRITGTLRNPRVKWEPIPLGGNDDRPEPPPAGDVAPPKKQPW